MRRKLVAGNWKLHGSRAFATELVAQIAAHMPLEGVDVVILPPLPYLGDLIEDFEEHHLCFGAQDVSSNEKGAYTGEVSATMLVDVGAEYGLVGHPNVASTIRKAVSWWRVNSRPPCMPG